ncbi:MAG: molybdenum cofactor biosynthesis protein [Acidimicrobiia bacterium]|nr:molybdenum cofactor biosynthesis protein [Acidimicrobiia bacterium]
MRPFGNVIPLDEARSIIAAQIRPIDRHEIVPLHEATGRVLAGDVVAAADVPPFSRAAMDGYAVRAEDTAGAARDRPVLLACVDQVFTGQMPGRAVGHGECVEIATGAPLPTGADAVVMVEDTSRDGTGPVQVFAAVQPAQHVGRQGADIAASQVVLRDGTHLAPARVGVLAATGAAEVRVYVRPRVAILSTGNEVASPGAPLEPGQIYDVNRFTLTAIAWTHGGRPEPHHTVGDDIDALAEAIDACLDADMLVFSGGSSVGERDLMLDALARRGRVLFHGLALKPGKPTAFGLVGGKPFFGMPGYPTSCLSNGYILLAPAIRAMARLPPQRAATVRAPLGARLVSPAGRHQIYTVALVDGAAMPAFKASGDITSMSQADGYIEIPMDVEVLDAGTVVEVTLF